MSFINRRDFVKSAAGASLAAPFLMKEAAGLSSMFATDSQSGVRVYLSPFGYNGVRLLDGMLKKQYDATRDYYFNLPNDDLLLGYRKRAGLPAPGNELGGWYSRDIGNALPQWLSAMARMYRATGDKPVLDKAVYLLTEWGKCIGPDGYFYYSSKPFPTTYTYDKTVCGLIDLYHFAGQKQAAAHLEKITDWAMKNLVQTNPNPTPEHPDASLGPPFTEENRRAPLEWYTLSENLYRAYQIIGNPKYRTFGDVWHYPRYWGMFSGNEEPKPYLLHAYSHCNTLSSAAMTYAVTGDPQYLRTIVNAYDYFDRTQFYATGGYGPTERLVPPDGMLGRMLENTTASFETPCGSWAGFKWAKYLMQFTGEAKYGDYIERLVYNGIGAALPMSNQGGDPVPRRGETFYYSNYDVGGARKVYHPETFPCCSGTYPQAVTDYHDLIYFNDPNGLYVNLYFPSQVTWNYDGNEVKVEQDTAYPEAETTTLRIDVSSSAAFNLKFRVPQWCDGFAIAVNGSPQTIAARPGTWATVNRKWNRGDVVKVTIPMRLRMLAVDQQHSNRIAFVTGPVVLVRDDQSRIVIPGRDPSKWLSPTGGPLEYRSPAPRTETFVPFYRVGPGTTYAMYFDVEVKG